LNSLTGGVGYKGIVIALNENGYRTEQGQRFRVYHIARILRNKAYIGTLKYNFRKDRGAREPLIIPGFYPPIIEETLFQRVQEKLKSASANKNKSGAKISLASQDPPNSYSINECLYPGDARTSQSQKDWI